MDMRAGQTPFGVSRPTDRLAYRRSANVRVPDPFLHGPSDSKRCDAQAGYRPARGHPGALRRDIGSGVGILDSHCQSLRSW